MRKTIKIKGQSSLKIVPDVVVFNLDLNVINLDYQTALNNHQANYHEIEKAIIDLGFKKEDLLTSNLDISLQYEYYDDNGKSKKRLLGYKINQEVKLSFPLNNKKINEVITSLAGTTVNPELRINFTVANPESYSDILLKNASADALKKAKLLTKNSNVSLGELLEIDYSWDEIHFESPSLYKAARANLMSTEMSFQPDVIEIKDTVGFLWEIN